MTEHKRYKRKFIIEIGDESTIVHTETEGEAINKGVKKIFGRNCFWFPNHEVPGYGQVFEALRPTKNNSNPGNYSVTCQTSIDVTVVGKPSSNFIKQQKKDAVEEAEIMSAIIDDAYDEWNVYVDGQLGNPPPQNPHLLSVWYDGKADQEQERESEL